MFRRLLLVTTKKTSLPCWHNYRKIHSRCARVQVKMNTFLHFSFYDAFPEWNLRKTRGLDVTAEALWQYTRLLVHREVEAARECMKLMKMPIATRSMWQTTAPIRADRCAVSYFQKKWIWVLSCTADQWPVQVQSVCFNLASSMRGTRM